MTIIRNKLGVRLPLSTTIGSEKWPQTRHLKTASLISGMMELHLMTIPFNDTIFSISGRKERTRWVEIPHGGRGFEIKNPGLYMLLKQGVDSTNHIHEHNIKNGKNF
ncbi:hypothetical protein Hanom_Chr03g00178581 [Helianthus anomalus]